MPEIEVEELSFTYAGKGEPALRNVSLEVDKGEVVLLAGRSGSGKSTLLKAINGLIPHRYSGTYKGAVRVRGLTVAETPVYELSRIVGTVMQEVSKQLFLPTVADDVAFGPSNLCIEREEIERRVEEALSRLGILHLKDRDVNELSGGEKQRVAIAGVLAMKPEIILMDEPLANLDSEGVATVQEVIKSFREEGKTVVIAEHRVEEVLEVGVDRVFVMREGTIVREVERVEELANFADELKVPAEAYLPPGIVEAPRISLPHHSPGVVAVEFRNVSFSYEDKPVLKGINLEIREGERVALLGNNGAGKSTMAKLMLGLLKPTEGSVLVYGRDTHTMEVYEVAPMVGLVFQDPFSMLFAETVREEIAFGPRNLGVPPSEIPGRVEEAAERCFVKHLLDFSPFASSHGEKKRICVASILSMKPRILVLDEPTAGQDYATYTAFMEFVDSLVNAGVIKTLVLITHDTDLAVEYTDRTIVLANGEIVADGPTRKVLSDSSVLAKGKIRETSLIRLGKRLTGGNYILSRKELAMLARSRTHS
ncbi:ABC transporter ATP-binding protein [Thermofilum pendens]|uniref:ABC transporter ATP-binding protein n=1 Tax=Thermofilum pendens TaxID=2269 RepID=UPI001FE13ED3|nr:ABC transporter ATP-binding protein [Thermofilum pendens]